MARGKIYQNDPSLLEDGFYAQDLGDNWKLVNTVTPTDEKGEIKLLGDEVIPDAKDLDGNSWMYPSRAERWRSLMPLVNVDDNEEENFVFVNQQNVIRVSGQVLHRNADKWQLIKPGIYRLSDPFEFLAEYPLSQFNDRLLSYLNEEEDDLIRARNNNFSRWRKHAEDKMLAIGIKISAPKFSEVADKLARFIPFPLSENETSSVEFFRDGTVKITGHAMLVGDTTPSNVMLVDEGDGSKVFVKAGQFLAFEDMISGENKPEEIEGVRFAPTSEWSPEPFAYNGSISIGGLEETLPDLIQTFKTTLPRNFGSAKVTSAESLLTLLLVSGVTMESQTNTPTGRITGIQLTGFHPLVETLFSSSDFFIEDLGVMPVGMSFTHHVERQLSTGERKWIRLNKGDQGEIVIDVKRNTAVLTGPCIDIMNGRCVYPGTYKLKSLRPGTLKEDLYADLSIRLYPGSYEFGGIGFNPSASNTINGSWAESRFRYILNPDTASVVFKDGDDKQPVITLKPMAINNGIYQRMRYVGRNVQYQDRFPSMIIEGNNHNYPFNSTINREFHRMLYDFSSGFLTPQFFDILPFKNKNEIRVECDFSVSPARWTTNLNTVVPPIMVKGAPLNTYHDYKRFEKLKETNLLRFVKDIRDQWYLEITEVFTFSNQTPNYGSMTTNPEQCGKRFLSISTEKAWLKLLGTVSIDKIDPAVTPISEIPVGFFKRKELVSLPVTDVNRAYLNEYFAVSDQIDAGIVAHCFLTKSPLVETTQRKVMIAPTPQVATKRTTPVVNGVLPEVYHLASKIKPPVLVELLNNWQEDDFYFGGRLVYENEKVVISRLANQYEIPPQLTHSWEYHSGLIIGTLYANAGPWLGVAPGFYFMSNISHDLEKANLFEIITFEKDGKKTGLFRNIMNVGDVLIYYPWYGLGNQVVRRSHTTIQDAVNGLNFGTEFHGIKGVLTKEHPYGLWLVNPSKLDSWGNLIVNNAWRTEFTISTDWVKTYPSSHLRSTLERLVAGNEYQDNFNNPWIHLHPAFPQNEIGIIPFIEDTTNYNELNVHWTGDPKTSYYYFDQSSGSSNYQGNVGTDLHSRPYRSKKNHNDPMLTATVHTTGVGVPRAKYAFMVHKSGLIVKPNVTFDKVMNNDPEAFYPPVCIWSGAEELHENTTPTTTSVGVSPNMFAFMKKSSSVHVPFDKRDVEGRITLEKLINGSRQHNPFAGAYLDPLKGKVTTTKAAEIWDFFKTHAYTPEQVDSFFANKSIFEICSRASYRMVNGSPKFSIKDITFNGEMMPVPVLDVSGWIPLKTYDIYENMRFIDDLASNMVFLSSIGGWQTGSGLGIDLKWHRVRGSDFISLNSAKAIMKKHGLYIGADVGQVPDTYKNFAINDYFGIKLEMIKQSGG